MLRMGLLTFVAVSLLVTGVFGDRMQNIGRGIPGGPIEADRNDQMFKTAVKKAVSHFNSGNNDMNLYKLNEIVSATSQVVSGIKYKFTVKLGRTSCRKAQLYVDAESCSLISGSGQTTHLCHFEIWSQPWISDEPSVTRHDCSVV
uniref:cystatin-like n=1 Tax=Myxine glutinosa TaxID=7769 RepID=UPI00358E0A01